MRTFARMSAALGLLITAVLITVHLNESMTDLEGGMWYLSAAIMVMIAGWTISYEIISRRDW